MYIITPFQINKTMMIQGKYLRLPDMEPVKSISVSDFALY